MNYQKPSHLLRTDNKEVDKEDSKVNVDTTCQTPTEV